MTASSRRSQLRNREAAAERLAELIAGALAEDPPRRPTRPSAGQRAAAEAERKRAAGRKAARRWNPGDEA